MSERKKILFCVTKGNFGGAQKYVYDLATNLSKAAFDIVVACGNKDGNALPQKLVEQNIRTIALENSEREINLKNDFKTFGELIKIIKEEKPDIVHLNSSKIGLLGSLAILYLRILNLFRASNFEFRICAVFTAHGWAFKEKGRSAFAKIVYYIAHYATVLICDRTIAVSEKTKSALSWLPFANNKMVVIHNGIQKFELLSKKEALAIIGTQKSEKVIVLSLSELHTNKGLDVALRGIALLPPPAREKISYYIAGDGEEKDNLEKLCKDLGIGEVVHFLGFVPEAKKILSAADIFLFPSRTENLPFAVLEAGQAELPVIATSVGGIPEIIKDMQNGILIHPKNPKEVAEGILYLLDNPSKRKQFGEELKKTVSNFFSFEKMLDETIAVYKST